MNCLKTEQCIYVRFNEDRSEFIILAVYVDDLIIAGTTQAAIMKVKQQITASFECKDLGELDRILNVEVTRSVEGGLFLSQSLYVKDVLEKFKQYLPAKGSKFNGAETPMDNKILLLQSLYVKDVLEKFKQYLPAKGFKFNNAETPMDNKILLHKKGAPQLRFKQKEIEVKAGAVKC